MNNELMQQKNWWKRNWKWTIPMFGITIVSLVIFFSSGMNNVASDLVQGYSDTDLYENALEKVKANQKVSNLLGEIEQIDKLAILEGSVRYTNKNKTVNSSIRIIGEKGNAKMDILAHKIKEEWIYKKLNIRIKKPIENKQTIEIIPSK